MVADKVREYRNANKSVKSGELGDIVARREAETEIIADQAGKLFDTEESIKIQHIILNEWLTAVGKQKKVILKSVRFLKNTMKKLCWIH